jgi:hypothetical protein
MNERMNIVIELMNSGFQSSSVPMHLDLLFYRPFVPLKVDGSPVRLIKFHIAPRLSCIHLRRVTNLELTW